MNTKKIRIRYRLTQQQFAEFFDIPLKTVQGWELKDTLKPELLLLYEFALSQSFDNWSKNYSFILSWNDYTKHYKFKRFAFSMIGISTINNYPELENEDFITQSLTK